MRRLLCARLIKPLVKNLLLTFFSLCILGFAALALLAGYAIHLYTTAGGFNNPKMVLIERGSGVNEIAQKLSQEKAISQPLIFKIAARFGDSLKAGEYEFPPQASMAKILEMMQEGDVFDRKITIAEGLTVQQIVKRLNAREDLDGQIKDIPKEGMLLPNTYHFVQGETRQDIINKMRDNMKRALDEEWERRADDLPFNTKEEALVLASIVEKETAVADERERVAGVFVNRLRKNMPLQTDPTVIYAITKGDIKEDGRGPLGRRLLRKDLQFNSPYNTYQNAGLPPGPIANPGIDAIKATLNPEKNEYIFFVADGTGGHEFAKTYAEHQRNVANWRKVRNSN